MQRMQAPGANLTQRLLRGVHACCQQLYRTCLKGRRFERWLHPMRDRIFQSLNRLHERAEIHYDRRHGVNTTGFVPITHDISQAGDANNYEPTPESTLALLMRMIPLTPADVFVDLGCGKGRVVCQVASHPNPIRKVIGVELMPDLVRIARQNAEKCAGTTPIEIIEGDAATFPMTDCTLVYLFNPFGGETLTRILENIERELAQNPRPLRIIYVNPRWAALFDAQPWLQRAEGEDCVQIWQAILPQPSLRQEA